MYATEFYNSPEPQTAVRSVYPIESKPYKSEMHQPQPVIYILNSINSPPPQYYTKNQNITTWLTKLKYYVEINKIYKNKKECLLNCLDEEILNLVKDCHYSKNDGIAYNELMSKLKNPISETLMAVI